MGNRAIIRGKNSNLGVYVHWNGGYESVYAFTQYCKMKGYRSPEKDSYGIARLTQVIGNFFGGTTSVGMHVFSEDMVELTEEKVNDLWLDNGVYEIEDWEIVKWWNPEPYDNPGEEVLQEFGVDMTQCADMIKVIDECMPEEEQLGKKFFNSVEVVTKDLTVGDKVILYDGVYENYKEYTVLGFGKPGHILNGTDVEGLPYTDRCDYRNNITAYIKTDTVRKITKEWS